MLCGFGSGCVFASFSCAESWGAHALLFIHSGRAVWNILAATQRYYEVILKSLLSSFWNRRYPIVVTTWGGVETPRRFRNILASPPLTESVHNTSTSGCFWNKLLSNTSLYDLSASTKSFDSIVSSMLAFPVEMTAD